MRRQIVRSALVRSFVVLSTTVSVVMGTIGGAHAVVDAPKSGTVSESVEERIAAFWKRVDAMQPGDFLSAADIGQWGLNVIERNPRSRMTVTDFRASTELMQGAMDRAGAGPAGAAPTPGVEERIGAFWRRVDAMLPRDFLSAAEIGQWALNVIGRNPRARMTVAEFRASTELMQGAMDRAGAGPAALRFPLRFQFGAAVPEVDRVDIERGSRNGLELLTTLGEEIGDVVTIYAVASAAGERLPITVNRGSCCFVGSIVLFGEYAAYYDVSNQNWNNPYITGLSRRTEHRKGGVHEFIHVWQDWAGCSFTTKAMVRRAPVWFTEGMAEYLAWRFTNEVGDASASELAQHESHYRSEAKRLLSTFPLSAVEAQHPPAERGSDMNGPAVTAVKMLAEAHGRPALRDFCKRSAREDWRVVFTQIFGRPVERFYEEYAAELLRP